MIHTLRATLSEDEARRLLSPAGISGFLSRWVRGDLRAIAAVFIPFRLYEVLIDDRGVRTSRLYAIDAASGLLDPYELPAIPDFDDVTTRNAITVAVPEPTTRDRAIEQMRRRLYKSGFFRLRSPQITAELIQTEFYVPYCVGFFGEERNLNLVVIDAIRHTREGSKVRRAILDWLRRQPAEESFDDT